MDERSCYIYALSHPITKEVRYIGKTIQPISSRYSQHLSTARLTNKKDYAHCWIKGILNLNLKPDIEILDILPHTRALEEEAFLIEYFKFIGVRLTNLMEGGISSKITINKNKRRPSNRPKRVKGITLYALDIETKNIIKCISRNQAKDVFNIEPATIKKYIKSNTLYQGKYLFSSTESFNLEFINTPRFNNKVICYNLTSGEILKFKNTIEAGKSLNIDNSSVSKCIKGVCKRIKNYKFEYEKLPQ